MSHRRLISMTKMAVSWLVIFHSLHLSALTRQWTQQEANQWFQKDGWRVGANYIPVDAENTIEAWQKETFDAVAIDRELAIAESAGLTTLRVFLNDLVWQADSSGFRNRLDQFLEIASRHHLRPVLVLFDSCWDPHPRLGPQPPPLPGVHNSRWVQSPGVDALLDSKEESRLLGYVHDVVHSFAHDSRILAWDVWNEPDNLNSSSYRDDIKKIGAVERLLPKVFAAARSADPSQPLTSGVWQGDWSSDQTLTSIQKTQLQSSDVISFHNYGPPRDFEERVRWLERFQRPVICTEYMARPLGSTIPAILPVAKKQKITVFNWGFISGKTQTIYAWDSWEHPYPSAPAIWFHDLFFPDGRPFDAQEIQLIKSLTATP